MSRQVNVQAEDALKRLKKGNNTYLLSDISGSDISPAIRLQTARQGQSPYAIIVTCSDSRVIPEAIFSAGIGELFVIRVAGNVIDSHQLGSIEYAAEHLGCQLVVVLGHTGCGAVEAAISGDSDGYIRFITDEIKIAIGNEKDDYRAGRLNVKRSVSLIQKSLPASENEKSIHVIGAMYHLDTGEVEYL